MPPAFTSLLPALNGVIIGTAGAFTAASQRISDDVVVPLNPRRSMGER
jgi:hypothetical protein